MLILNLLVDILLVRIIKRDLKFKKEIIDKLNRSSSAKEKSKSEQAKYKTIIEADKNTNKMIVYSFLLYLICRLPELCLYFYFIFSNRYNAFVMHSFGPVAINVVEYMFVLSYSFNLLFYYKFNKNFRDAFKNFFTLKN